MRISHLPLFVAFDKNYVRMNVCMNISDGKLFK